MADGGADHVRDIWDQFVPRRQRRALTDAPDDVLTALSGHDRATLAEAADLLVRTTGELDPTRWLAKARLGSRLLTQRRNGTHRLVPPSFDPFASDRQPDAAPPGRPLR